MESVPTPCFNFKGISLSPEFGLHTWITELRCMGINSTHTIDFTQLAFEGSELKAHLCHLMVWQNLQCTFINWMHFRKPKVFCSFCNICQGASKTGSILDIWVPAELQQIYEGSLKGNASLLND